MMMVLTMMMTIIVIILCIAATIVFVIHQRRHQPPSVGIVVAHYKEDLSWLSEAFQSIPRKKFYIYTKSEDKIPPMTEKHSHHYLENVGVCDHTYLHHIIDRYDRLEDITIFVTGSTYHLEHKKYQLDQVLQHYSTHTYFPYHSMDHNNDESIRAFSLSAWCPSHDMNNPEHDKTCTLSRDRFKTFGAFYDELIHQGPINKLTVMGIFSAHRANIRQHPQFFYQNIIPHLNHKNDQNSHFMERSWAMILADKD
jgi:hypothetical protein